MNIVVVLLIVLLIFGGLGGVGYGWHSTGYAGGPFVGVGGGLIGLIVLLLVLHLLGVL